MNIQESIKYWTDIATYDLETVEAMLQTGRYLYVGFMCHQTIEKGLKAHIVKHTHKIPPEIHNRPRLAALCDLYQHLSETQKDFLDKIDRLNIETRYPSYKEFIYKLMNREMCVQVLAETKEFYRWLMNRL